MSAPPADLVRGTVEKYLQAHGAARTAAVIGLFSPGATVEDPVGGSPRVGLDALRAFYTETHERQGAIALDPVGSVIVGGNEGAVHVRASGVDADPDTAVDVLYVFTVDAQRRITRLRAFFDPR